MIGLLRCIYTLVELKSKRIGLLIVELRHLDNSIRSRAKRAYTEWNWVMQWIAFCACSKSFPRGREAVEGDDSLVVVAIEKRERAIYFKRWRRKWRKPMNVVIPIRIVSRPGSAHGMHSVKVEAHWHYASISPKAELKVHAFLNVDVVVKCH